MSPSVSLPTDHFWEHKSMYSEQEKWLSSKRTSVCLLEDKCFPKTDSLKATFLYMVSE